ncbi:hypothetical protein MARCHEWKA_01540 [Brevundimonas phage vB_BpoS-Marchewka]|uniref:Uncharacterized protein n=1 Tax=Brevundimonas phage vB_BpoS-Marchewka TaxID=2948604 RepID=A0A9E7N516_9CAUD|nr:hypothetical protein MARCHEWKA_01540 [Brevundimonas phage vB_BpoS-Marchewka]
MSKAPTWESDDGGFKAWRDSMGGVLARRADGAELYVQPGDEGAELADRLDAATESYPVGDILSDLMYDLPQPGTVEVENYVQDLTKFSNMTNGGRGSYGTKRAPGRLMPDVLARILSDAKGEVDQRGGIDWSQYGEPKAIFDDMITCQVEWTHVRGGILRLNRIHWDDATGEIVQCGTEYGDYNV